MKAAVVPKIEEPMTVPRAEDALPYVMEMLGELRTRVEGFDWMLAYLIEMAHMHASELEQGRVRMEKARKHR